MYLWATCLAALAATAFGASDTGNMRKQNMVLLPGPTTFFDKLQRVITPEVKSEILPDFLAFDPRRRLNQVNISRPTPWIECRDHMLRYGNKSNQSHCNCELYHLREDRNCSMCTFGYYGNTCKKCEAVTATFGCKLFFHLRAFIFFLQ